MAALIQCDNITKRVGNFVLRDIDFALEPGYILGVIGCNGAGKTTLVRVLLGSYKLNACMDFKHATKAARGMAANRGDVCIEGNSLRKAPQKYKSELACILNECPFAMGLSVKENGILYGGYYEGFDLRRYEDLCREYEVPYTAELKTLSKGEQVKMQLAFALSREAKLYIFDEPAGNLDVRFRDRFYDVMRSIVEQGDKGVIYVTHLVEELEQLADYVLWIEEGRQKGFGTLEGLLDEYLLYSGGKGFLKSGDGYEVICLKQGESHTEALLHSAQGRFPQKISERGRRASLKEVMYYEEEARRKG